FVAGLIAAPWLHSAIGRGAVDITVTPNLALLVSAGLLVGFGAVWGSGCTSGHGVCGVARLSKRSIVATAVFMTSGLATVFVSRHLLGG
ncbi:MAG: YeeE/YedE thiosulfate transporter family protein, partial [Hyphomicrobium sp.]|nr:YeeE/YedE thiosulfate transporter family protein [Hyphomicrobium sp.]